LILHVGNIANNAWQNAKLLSDDFCWTNLVLCPDYYHAMSAPEWEDAEIVEQVNVYAPLWFKCDLKDYKRPDNFLCGPERLILKVAQGMLTGERSEWLEKNMCIANGTFPASAVLRNIFRIYWRFGFRSIAISLFLVMPLSVAWFVLSKLGLVEVKFNKWVLHLAGLIRDVPILGRCADAFRKGSGRYNLSKGRINNLIRDFETRFPNRIDKLTEEDFKSISINKHWVSLFEASDIVQCYSIDPIKPMVLGVPYFAFEHGTLRDIPFENSPRGRLTSLAYARSEHVFVTNFDCLENAYLHPLNPARTDAPVKTP